MKFRITFLLVLVVFLFERCETSSKEPDPILILATNSNYGTYSAEILKAEGLNLFHMDSLKSPKVKLSYLSRFDLVILAETTANDTQKEMLIKFVKNGGKLIAFKPDKSFSELFGITYAEEILTEGYLAVDSGSVEGKGITKETMQFHAHADHYILDGAKVIANIFTNNHERTHWPAVVSNDFGKGHAIAFLYNMPQSIVYTRQGNPLFAGIEKDGIPGLRGLDLFTDGWLDTTNNTINQADQQMALLTNCIVKMSSFTKPLPRYWYFPDTLKCLVTLTNDGEFRSEYDFESQFNDIDSMGAKMSLYILQGDKVSKSWVQKWVAKGHEISGHPDDTHEASNPTWAGMDKALDLKKAEIADIYSLPFRTVVNHWFVWCGNNIDGSQNFGAQAQLEEKHGIEMDLNYAHYDINSNQGAFYLGTPGINQGNFIGSGLTMKYADVNGSTINVYQHFNAVYDQQYNESNDPDGFFDCFKGLVDRSLNNDIFSIVSVKAHNDEYYFSKEPIARMLDYAEAHDLPVWTSVQLLDFLKMKDEASFQNIRWENNQLSFELNSSLRHASGLTFLIPVFYSDLRIKEILKGGVEHSFIVRPVRGVYYAFVTVEPGQDYNFTITYSN